MEKYIDDGNFAVMDFQSSANKNSYNNTFEKIHVSGINTNGREFRGKLIIYFFTNMELFRIFNSQQHHAWL